MAKYCDVSVIAVAQASLGICLCTTGYGAGVGMGMIAEGLGDAMFAINAGLSRDFSWKAYGIQKSISLAVTTCTLGRSGALSNAYRGVQVTLQKQIGEEIVERGALTLIQCNKEIIKQTGKKAFLDALEYTGIKAVENVVRDGINKSASSFVGAGIDAYHKQILEAIMIRIQIKFADTFLERLILKICIIDRILGSSLDLESKIFREISIIQNEQYSLYNKDFQRVFENLNSALLSTSSVNQEISIGLKIAQTVNGMYEVVFLIDNMTKVYKISLKLLIKNFFLLKKCLHHI